MSTAGFRKRCKCQFVPLHAEAQDSLINPWKIQFIQRLCRSVLGLIGELLPEILYWQLWFPLPPWKLFSQDANKPWFSGVLALSWGAAAGGHRSSCFVRTRCDCSRSLAQQEHWSLTAWAVCVREKKQEGERVISHRSKCFFALL